MVEITKRQAVEIGLTLALVGVAVGLPIYAQTNTYPMAIVQGNSMFPTLHSGDLVIFGKPPTTQIANQSIIVFVQGDTGVSALDSIVRPVVIHRIVGTVNQTDGTLLYRTKGDNNQFVDPSLTQANHVLGVPIAVIPRVGLFVLFLESPEGLVTLIGIISLFYLGKYEMKMKEDEMKERFLGELTSLVLDGELSHGAFEALEPVVKYGKKIHPDAIEDELVASLLSWVKKGGLERKWKTEKMDCPKCSSRATAFKTGKDLEFLLCSHCAMVKDEKKAGPYAPPVARQEGLSQPPKSSV